MSVYETDVFHIMTSTPKSFFFGAARAYTLSGLRVNGAMGCFFT